MRAQLQNAVPAARKRGFAVKEELSVLQSSALFQGIDAADCEKILNCLSTGTKRYAKNEIILLAGEPVASLGVIVSGRVQIIKEDLLGSRSIVAELSTGEIFGEALALAQVKQSPVTVLASSECQVVRLSAERILSPCPTLCDHHTTLLRNMMRLLAEKNVVLNRKMDILSQKTTRDKVQAYLSQQARRQNTLDPVIPFSREELADFLCVNRSALSKELGRMQEEGLIRFTKNRFSLYPGQRDRQP